MKPNKIFVITNDQEHFWFSNNVIEDAVHEAFKDQQDISWIHTNEIILEKDLNLVDKYSKTHQTFIYFLSDHIDYPKLVRQLQVYRDLNYILPIYGNMTVEIERWLELNKILAGERVLFLAASHRSAQQLSLFIKGGEIVEIPYPISEMHFRTPTHNDHPEIGIIYAGRLTPQKNILGVMQTFNLAKEIVPNLKLHIAGNFHDISYPLHGLALNLEAFKKDFYDQIEKSNGGIIYHGQLGQEELLDLNSTCDYTLSMSTHHDEDFGVSIAQGLAQGLIPIVSNWGGHPNYTRLVDGVLVPISVNDQSIPHFSVKHLLMVLLDLKKMSLDQKKHNQIKAKSYLSTTSFHQLFNSVLKDEIPRYLGQSDLFLRYAEIFKEHDPFCQSNPPGKIFDYFSIYRTYLEDLK